MFNFKIDKVADTLINQSKLFNCTMEVTWNDYMHPLIKEEFTLEEVLKYIEDNGLVNVIEFRRCKNCKYTGKKYVCMNCFDYSKYETNKNRIRKAPLEKRI